MMLKILVKKQMMEIFRSYFYDAKKNKARSKSSTAMCIGGFAILMILIGVMFGAMSSAICLAMAQANVNWLYFALISLLAVIMGAFGSVFNTYSGLYLAKDNDQLLSLPISVGAIVASRLVGVYLMGLMYSATVSLPAAVIYWFKVDSSPIAILGGLLLIFLISMIVLFLSCALGWVVAKISLKLKNKSFVTVIAAVLFIAAYYYVYFNALNIISELIANAGFYAEKIKGMAYPIYLIGKIGTGDVKAALIVYIVSALLCYALWRCISGSFIKIATSSQKSEKKVYKREKLKQKSTFAALFSKEAARFTSSPNYMLNCGFGILIMIVGTVAFAIKGKTVYEVFGEFAYAFGAEGADMILLCAMVCAVASMNDMATPSVSLEGKSIWIAQSLPVKAKQVLDAKLSLQLVLNEIPILIFAVCAAFVCRLSAVKILCLVLFCTAFTVFMALLDLFLGLKMPNLTWSNEITPIKQSFAVFIAMFGGFILVLALTIGYFIFGCKLGFEIYSVIVSAVITLVSYLIYKWIKTKGAEIFAYL